MLLVLIALSFPNNNSVLVLSMTMTTTIASPPPYPVRVAVMGGGNFGLALASVCARQGIPTTLLVRSEEIAKEINANHKHPRYMNDLVLPNRIRATTKPDECLPDATYIVHAVPCQYSREFLEEVKEHIPPNTPVLSGSKGIETTSLGFMLDILQDCLGEDRPYAFLSGPSFAREMVQGVATAVVVASEDMFLARDLAELLSDQSFRVFTSRDVVGIEVGGAVKNVIALAAGMCEGLGLGTNAMSALVTRGCGEMRRLGTTLGARSATLAGLSGTFLLLFFFFFFCAAHFLQSSSHHYCAAAAELQVLYGKSCWSIALLTTVLFVLFSFRFLAYTTHSQVSVTHSELVSARCPGIESSDFDWDREKRWTRFGPRAPKWRKVLTLPLLW